jgi:hypothetical protein
MQMTALFAECLEDAQVHALGGFVGAAAFRCHQSLDVIRLLPWIAGPPELGLHLEMMTDCYVCLAVYATALVN